LWDFEMCGIFKLFVFLQWNMWCFSSILCTFLVLCVDSCLRFLYFSIILWYFLYSNLSVFILCFSGDYFKNSDYDVLWNDPSNLYFTNIFEDLVIAVYWGKTYQIVIMNRLTKPTAICRYLRSLTIVIRVLSGVEWSQCVRFEVRIKAIDLSSTQTDLSFKNVYEHLKDENIIMVIVIRIKHNFTVILTVSLIGVGSDL
jgi:hypothetical protein